MLNLKLIIIIPLTSFILFFSLPITSSAQTCKTYTFSTNAVYSSCVDLPVLSSFLHYNYNPSSLTLQVAYRRTGVSSSSWTAWAINPVSSGMIGAQALVAFQQMDGTMSAYTSPISSYQTQLQQGDLSFNVSDLSATYSNNEMIIFASLGLSGIMSGSTLNHVWQEGSLSGNSPQRHPTSGPNVRSSGTLNLVLGQTGSSGGSSRESKKKIHGILNTVGWGIMMPVGAITARYLKQLESAGPSWFYLHVYCQSCAYATGVAGWGLGLKLGIESQGIQYNTHRTIGIILFCLGTLQVFALLLRPRPDHNYRCYWNIYHHLIGYVVISLSVINIFKGFDILQPQRKWKDAYIGVISALAFCALLLETSSLIPLRNKSEEKAAADGMSGDNAANGQDARADLSIYQSNKSGSEVC